MKKIIILLLLTITGITSYSQATLAKFKYEEAEEAFQKNDYKLVYKNLDEVEKILGGANPKTLYLRISAQVKHIGSDPDIDFETIEKARSNVKTYLAKYESPDNEERYRDVYKYSQQLEKYAATQADYEANRAKITKRREELSAAADRASKAIEAGSAILAKYKWKPGIKEDEFSSAAGLYNYKWERNPYTSYSTSVTRKKGLAMSVSSYYPEGPGSYMVSSSTSIVSSYSFNLKKGKSVTEEYRKEYEAIKALYAGLGEYVAEKKNIYTISVPVSPQQPNKIAYIIVYSLGEVEKWSFLAVGFEAK